MSLKGDFISSTYTAVGDREANWQLHHVEELVPADGTQYDVGVERVSVKSVHIPFLIPIHYPNSLDTTFKIKIEIWDHAVFKMDYISKIEYKASESPMIETIKTHPMSEYFDVEQGIFMSLSHFMDCLNDAFYKCQENVCSDCRATFGVWPDSTTRPPDGWSVWRGKLLATKHHWFRFHFNTSLNRIELSGPIIILDDRSGQNWSPIKIFFNGPLYKILGGFPYKSSVISDGIDYWHQVTLSAETCAPNLTFNNVSPANIFKIPVNGYQITFSSDYQFKLRDWQVSLPRFNSIEKIVLKMIVPGKFAEGTSREAWPLDNLDPYVERTRTISHTVCEVPFQWANYDYMTGSYAFTFVPDIIVWRALEKTTPIRDITFQVFYDDLWGNRHLIKMSQTDFIDILIQIKNHG